MKNSNSHIKLVVIGIAGLIVLSTSFGIIAYRNHNNHKINDSKASEIEEQTEVIEVKDIDDVIDNEPPVINGAEDKRVLIGETITYREGITVTDNNDANPKLSIDTSQVDINNIGSYIVVYKAEDSSGNTATKEVTIEIYQDEPIETEETTELEDDTEKLNIEKESDNTNQNKTSNETKKATTEAVKVEQPAKEPTLEDISETADKILSSITNDGMTQEQKCRAIYNYVYENIKYVGKSDKSSWIKGAYDGFTYRRGDCFNYYACARILIERIGLPVVPLQRVGGTSRHYWLLTNIGTGWLHFDACWAPSGYSHDGCLFDEPTAREYTERVKSVRLNYYVYDYENCPVVAVGTPVDEVNTKSESIENTDNAEVTTDDNDTSTDNTEVNKENTQVEGTEQINESENIEETEQTEETEQISESENIEETEQTEEDKEQIIQDEQTEQEENTN